MTKLRIVALSDTHTKHSQLTIPECDILVHCGDFTWTGKFFEVRDFLNWFEAQPAKHKVFIAGNHELTLDSTHSGFSQPIYDMVKNWRGLTYLDNQAVEIEGVKFYGTPWTPWFHDWGFNGLEEVDIPFRRGRMLTETYGDIPADTDILICHGPPRDLVDQESADERLGSIDMRNQIDSGRFSKLKLYLCGHLHDARDQERYNGVLFCNVSSLDRAYERLQKPVMIDLDVNQAKVVSGYENL